MPSLPDLTDAQLEALSEISASDREAAAAAWKADAPPAGKPLLDATEWEGEA